MKADGRDCEMTRAYQQGFNIFFTMNADEEPIAKRRRMTKERKARWLARQRQESLDRIRAVDAAAYKRRIEAETPAQSQARRERYAEAHHIV
ncbi:hypothetical protein AVEN_23955-1 [Araneus ventricosus]|uniref:Uncharacterized protein n=1 Tax=Araneus ventricosus TaxID=182803 RepID=A0A4Y2WE16_ARAVE|nr:hypothetical protein AVEN_23955-1 [Araneus ventricosus]